jgi:hypothetical protein
MLRPLNTLFVQDANTLECQFSLSLAPGAGWNQNKKRLAALYSRCFESEEQLVASANHRSLNFDSVKHHSKNRYPKNCRPRNKCVCLRCAAVRCDSLWLYFGGCDQKGPRFRCLVSEQDMIAVVLKTLRGVRYWEDCARVEPPLARDSVLAQVGYEAGVGLRAVRFVNWEDYLLVTFVLRAQRPGFLGA